MSAILTYPSDARQAFQTLLSDITRNNVAVEKSSRELLADNLKALAADAKVSINGWAASKRLQERKAARAAGNETDTRLDTLDEIARAAQRKPWELIAPPGPIEPPAPAIGGDLDYLLTKISSRERRILAYSLAAQVIEAVGAGLVVRPIHMREPGLETPRVELLIDQPSETRTPPRRSTGRA